MLEAQVGESVMLRMVRSARRGERRSPGGSTFPEDHGWGQICSSGSVSRERIGDMKFYRMAEILIPNRVGLEHLKHIVCSTAPERDTLLHLLPEGVRQKWRS